MPRIAAAQTPEFRDDIEGAIGCLRDFAWQADDAGAALLCFPEGFLQGYPTDDAPARRQAIDLGGPAFTALLRRLPLNDLILIFGLIELQNDRLFNTAVVVQGQSLIGRYRKTHLLRREQCFDAGNESQVFAAGDWRFGINICHDTNFPPAARTLAEEGAQLIVCPANNMMPCSVAEKWKDVHNEVRAERCRETGLWLISADVTGERERHVAWGPTAVLTPAGEVAAQLPLGLPGLLVFDLPIVRNSAHLPSHHISD